MGHADGGNVENRSQMESKTGPARVISTRGVDEEDGRDLGQQPDGRLEERAFSQCQEPRLVASSAGTAGDGCSCWAVRADQGRARPSRVARRSDTPAACREADETASHREGELRKPPGIGLFACQRELLSHQVLDGSRPLHDHSL